MKYQDDTKFMQCIKLVIESEGGGKYTNAKVDHGGPTKFGISWKNNAARLIAMGIKDVRNLKEDQAKEIFYLHYWLESEAHLIPDVRLAYMHFDSAVLDGPGQAALFLYRLSKHPADYADQGHNEPTFLRLILEYLAQRLHFYTHAQTAEQHLEGWDNRLVAVVHNLLAMRVTPPPPEK